jgi:hypothetical protein
VSDSSRYLLRRFSAEGSDALPSMTLIAWDHDRSANPAMRTLTTSGRPNSEGGYSPLPSISLTFVPEKKTWEEGLCGQVLADAMPMHSLQ